MSTEFENETIDSSAPNCVKLFVGQIPREMDEDTLIPYFAEFGPIVELTVIRDRVTKLHKGCAFVTYLESSSAQQAIEQLHDKIKLGGAINPLQVRIAECQVERENKLFIGMLPKTVNEEQLHDMFVRFGDLREVHIIRGPEGSSKGCAFVKFVDREAALLAIDDMNNRIPEGSTRPLVIKFADVKKHGKKVDSQEDYLVDRMNAASMKDPNFWPPQSVSTSPQYFYPPYNYPTSPVIPQQIVPVQSYVHYGSHPVSTESPYVVINNPPQSYMPHQQMPVQNDLGNRRYNSQQFKPPPISLQELRYNSASPGISPTSVLGPQTNQSSPTEYDTNAPSPTRPPEGPAGANLFIYHLPRDLTDADLATLFAPFGNVISAKVFVDKKTSDSKGFGFVSFDSVESADASILSMNGFQIGSKRLKVQHKRTGEDPQLSPIHYDSYMVPPPLSPTMQVLTTPSPMNYPPSGTYLQPQPGLAQGRTLTHLPAAASNTPMYQMYRGHGVNGMTRPSASPINQNGVFTHASYMT